MNKNVQHLETHRRWLETFNQPLVTMRQELVGLIKEKEVN
jgi:hypothetical protein